MKTFADAYLAVHGVKKPTAQQLADMDTDAEREARLVEVLRDFMALDFYPHGKDPGECMSMCPVCQTMDKARALLAEIDGGER